MTATRFSPVGAMFHDLRDDPGLKDRPSKRMRSKLFRRTNTQKPTDQTSVVKEQFRHLHEPLAQVCVKRRQRKTIKLASRILAQAFALGCEMAQSLASDE